MSDKRTIAALSLDAKALCDFMSTVPVGETVKYADLVAATGRGSLDDIRGALHTARKILERDHQMVFGVVWGEGLRHLTDTEGIGTCAGYLRHMRKTAKQGARRATSAKDLAGLPNGARIEMNAYASMFGAIHQATRMDRIKKLETRVAETQTTLPLAKTLEIFKG